MWYTVRSSCMCRIFNKISGKREKMSSTASDAFKNFVGYATDNWSGSFIVQKLFIKSVGEGDIRI